MQHKQEQASLQELVAEKKRIEDEIAETEAVLRIAKNEEAMAKMAGGGGAGSGGDFAWQVGGQGAAGLGGLDTPIAFGASGGNGGAAEAEATPSSLWRRLSSAGASRSTANDDSPSVSKFKWRNSGSQEDLDVPPPNEDEANADPWGTTPPPPTAPIHGGLAKPKWQPYGAPGTTLGSALGGSPLDGGGGGDEGPAEPAGDGDEEGMTFRVMTDEETAAVVANAFGDQMGGVGMGEDVEF